MTAFGLEQPRRCRTRARFTLCSPLVKITSLSLAPSTGARIAGVVVDSAGVAADMMHRRRIPLDFGQDGSIASLTLGSRRRGGVGIEVNTATTT